MYQISILIRNYKNYDEKSSQVVVYSYLQIRTEVVKSSLKLEWEKIHLNALNKFGVIMKQQMYRQMQ